MKLAACLKKTFRENLREWKILILVLVFGPFFVYMMYAYFGGAAPSYGLLIINRDRPALSRDGKEIRAGQDLAAEWAKARYPDGKPIFKVRPIQDEEEGRRLLRSRDADLLIVVPDDFSRSLLAARDKTAPAPAPLRNIGDERSVRYMAAVSFADSISYPYTASAMGLALPTVFAYEGIGALRSPSDFDLYVPALLVLAVIMVLFTAAASLIKEVDKGTIVRLILSRLTPFEYLAALSLNQLLIGTAALALTYFSALSVGYRSGGSLLLFLAVGALSVLSVMAISLLVAGWMRTIFELLTVGVFPFFVLMFFSESMFPLPKITLFRLAGHAFYVNDVLPTALTVKAFNKILNFGAGLPEVAFEVAGILILTAGYFAAGLWLFRRRHLRPR